jgi:DNA-binding GntR family transcriptional regulator
LIRGAGDGTKAPDFTLVRPQTTLRDQVVAKLRDAIIAVHFQPGSRLIERQLCELLGVSRTLMREALRQLEAEGWVQLLPYRGPVVASMTAVEVRELYEVRVALEGLAAQFCAERATPAQLKQMTAAVRAMTAAQRSGDLPTQREQAGIFYGVLREAAGNRLLQARLAALSSRLAWLRTIALSHPTRAAVSVREEQVLLAAIRKRDGRHARALCEQHLLISAQVLIEALAALPAVPPSGKRARRVTRDPE